MKYVLGTIIIIDGVLSIFLAYEPRLLWQIGRFIRIIVGIMIYTL